MITTARSERVGKLLVLALLFAVPITYPSIFVGVSWRQGFGFTLTLHLAILAALVVWLGAYLLFARGGSKPTLVMGLPEIALGLMILADVVSSAVSISYVRAIRLDVNLMVNAAVYLALRQLAVDRNQMRPLILTLAASGLFVSVIGLLQYFFYEATKHQMPVVPMFVVPYVGPRLQSTFEGPNYFGTYAVVVLAPILWATRWQWQRWQKWWVWLASLSLVAAGLLTFSRFNQVLILLTVIGFAAISWRSGFARRNVLVMAAVVIVIGALTWLVATPGLVHRTTQIVNPLDDPNFNTRLGEYGRALEMFASHPALGVGPGQATLYLPLSYGQPDVIHNDLINRFAEGGLLGGGVFVFFWAALLWGAWRTVRAQDRRDIESFGFTVAWFAALVLTILDVQLYPRFYEPTVWLAYGMASGIGAWTLTSPSIRIAVAVPLKASASRQPAPS